MADTTVVRYSFEGEKFEILVKPDPALDYKLGKKKDISSVLISDEIYTDFGKGTKPSTEKLLAAFKTEDKTEIAQIMFEKGDLNLTTDQRRKMVEQKRKQIVAHIVANAMNPQTGGPHPPQRIENAIDEVRYSVDPMENMDKQIEKIIKSIKTLIPISFEKIRVAVKIKAIHVGKCYGQITSLSKIESEEYQKDGSWIGMLEMSAASFAKLEDALGSLTKGTAETKML